MKDYYYILGIKNDASVGEVKKAYRKLSLKFHPDKNDGDEFFTKRFKEILEAYETLIDKQSREEYDKKILYSKNKQGYEAYNFEPKIIFFETNKTSFFYDEEIIFRWKTINTDRVVISPFGAVKPIGQKTYRIKNFRNPSLTFKLVAENTNINIETTSSIQLKNKTYQELYIHFRNIIQSENDSKNHNNSREKTNPNKPIGVFNTDKGVIEVELNFNGAEPAINNRVFQNGKKAKNGKYKLGTMNYIVVKNGVIVGFSSF